MAHAQVPDYVPTDGLVVWYPLDGDATDFGPFNIQPEYAVAEPAANRFEQEGRALSFIGDEDFIQGHADLFPVTDRTLSFWFNMPLDSPENWLIGYGGGASGTSTLLYSNSVQCNIGNSLAHSEHGCQSVFGISLSTLQANVWHHCVLSSDSLGSLLYIDGTIASNGPALGSVNTSNRHFFIGGGPSPDGEALEYNFHGQLDEVGIWNRSLTDTEIQGLFTSVAPIFGCTDPEACNYSTLANIDDESCHYPLIPGDCNAGSVACADGTYWNSLIQQCVPTSCPTCPGDGDGDLVIGVSDLLLLLGAFGSDCPETGCTDSQATNYNPNVVINDGSCVYPPCLDAQEPGAACDDGNPNTFNTYWDEDGCLCEGSEYVAEDGSGPCDGLGTVTYQGHDYQLVEIGDQCWFAENLQAFNHTNGDGIPSNLSNEEWSTTEAGAVGVYGQSAEGCGDSFTPGYNACDTLFSLANFGRLYNFYSVEDPRGLCPSDWVVASDTAWMEMEIHLGMSLEEANSNGWRGTNQGHILKTTEFWYNSGNGIDSLGFAAAPGGYRHYNYGAYVDAGYNSDYWTSSPVTNSNHGISRLLFNNQNGILRGTPNKGNGRSIRCIKSETDICFDPDGDGVCPEDEISGCTDETACNFDAEATHDDESCIPNQEAGSSCDDGDDNTFNDAWDAETCTCAGTPAVAEDGSGPCEGALTVNYHGYDYLLVEIGEQCWFAENLRATDYSNGDSMQGGLTNDEWSITTEGAQTIYDNDSTNLVNYGRSYNWYAASDPRGACPSGWRVPNTENLTQLTDHLGGAAIAGDALKANVFGDFGDENSNSSGFGMRAGGNRSLVGYFSELGSHGYIWSTTPLLDQANARSRSFLSTSDEVGDGYTYRRTGFSVRCLKIVTDTCFDPDSDGVCPEDEISGCTDETACNFDAEATHDDESCIPNHEAGSSCDDGDDNTFNDAWDAETCTCAGTPAVAEDGSGPCEGVGTVTYHGYEYQLVEIGDQCWFAENLRNEHYANGDAIPGDLSDGEWNSTTNGAMTVYGEGTSTVYNGSDDEVSNLTDYGRLYNWYAVDDARGLCPSGWHVPTDGEFMTLEMELGMSESEANGTDWRGTDQGTQMKSSPEDSPSWNGTNSSGFSGLAGGNRYYDGDFYSGGNLGCFWSASAGGTYAWGRVLGGGYTEVVFRNNYYLRHGFSVRCLKIVTDTCFDPDSDGVCPEDEISGCIDETACNYNAEATHDDGSCIPSQEAGSSCDDGDANTFNDAWDAESCMCAGTPAVAEDGSGPCEGVGTVTYHGYEYQLVEIGDQCWFAENLRTELYSNGDEVPNLPQGADWQAATNDGSGAWVYFSNNPDSGETFGKLYNWYVTVDERGICPTSWHVPENAEWSVLVDHYGGAEIAAIELKGNYSDEWFGNGTSGFNALPGGFRDWGNSVFFLQGTSGDWWTSSNQGAGFWRGMDSNSNNVHNALYGRAMGNSIRCLKD